LPPELASAVSLGLSLHLYGSGGLFVSLKLPLPLAVELTLLVVTVPYLEPHPLRFRNAAAASFLVGWVLSVDSSRKVFCWTQHPACPVDLLETPLIIILTKVPCWMRKWLSTVNACFAVGLTAALARHYLIRWSFSRSTLAVSVIQLVKARILLALIRILEMLDIVKSRR